MSTIQNLQLLDNEGEEWGWICGAFDFHCRWHADLDVWLLQQFQSNESGPDAAHRGETEHEDFRDALLRSMDIALMPQSGEVVRSPVLK